MSTLIENIERIATAKEEIRQSIINKGVEVSEDLKIEDYSSKIDLITTGQPGGGGEDVYSTNGYKLLYYSGQVDSSTAEESAPLIEYLQSYAIDHLINITNASSLCEQAYLTKNNLIKILSKDFSKCKTLNSAFDKMILVDENHRTSYNTNGGTLDISMDLSSCTNMNGTFNGFIATNSHYITQFNFDFNGTTSKVTDFGSTFRAYMSSNLNGPKYIKNINMDKCTGCSDIFYIASGSGDEKLKQLTFKGSFGGLSKTSSLTLKLPGAYNQTNKYTYEAFMETLNSVSENTNGKTRIFSVPAVIYNQLTENDILIAIGKGYEISRY